MCGSHVLREVHAPDAIELQCRSTIRGGTRYACPSAAFTASKAQIRFVIPGCAVRAKPELSHPVLFLVMFNETKAPPSPNDLLKNSSLYSEFQAEPEEIMKDKRPESGRASHEVGFERALADWLIKHRSSWRESRQPETQLSRISIS